MLDSLRERSYLRTCFPNFRPTSELNLFFLYPLLCLQPTAFEGANNLISLLFTFITFVLTNLLEFF